MQRWLNIYTATSQRQRDHATLRCDQLITWTSVIHEIIDCTSNISETSTLRRQRRYHGDIVMFDKTSHYRHWSRRPVHYSEEQKQKADRITGWNMNKKISTIFSEKISTSQTEIPVLLVHSTTSMKDIIHSGWILCRCLRLEAVKTFCEMITKCISIRSTIENYNIYWA